MYFLSNNKHGLFTYKLVLFTFPSGSRENVSSRDPNLSSYYVSYVGYYYYVRICNIGEPIDADKCLTLSISHRE